MSAKGFWDRVAMIAGILGVIVCAAAAVCVWVYGGRLAAASAGVFAGVDTSLASVHGRVLGVRQRVREMKVTAEDVGTTLSDWSGKQAAGVAASRLHIEEKAGQLAQGMERAGRVMEVSEASLRGLKQTFEAVGSLGLPVEGARIDPLIERMSTLRGGFEQAAGAVDGIRERTEELGSGDARQERIEQLAQLVARASVAMSDLDSRLGDLAEKVSGVQVRAQSLKGRIALAIRTAQGAAILLLAWMAAGQASLCLRGRSRLRLSRRADLGDASQDANAG